MSLTCFECSIKGISGPIVAGLDALRQARWPEATDILNQQDIIDEQMKKFPSLAHLDRVGLHKNWDQTLVFMPDLGVSFGPCEDCRETRPCRNL